MSDAAAQLARLEAEVERRRLAAEGPRLPLAGNDVLVLHRAACEALRRAQLRGNPARWARRVI